MPIKKWIQFMGCVIILAGCHSKVADKYKESENHECLKQKINNQFIVHWKYKKVQLLDIIQLKQFMVENESQIQFVEPNYKLYINEDTRNLQQDSYSLVENILAESSIESQWSLGYLGQNQIVAVIDSGVNLKHPNLINHFYQNASEIPGNGLDDDQNGFVDDVSGWNFVSQNPVVVDEIGHGTSMAGIITGSSSNQSQKSLGLAPESLVLPLDILSSSTGSEFDAKKAIDYAILMKVNIINNSWSIQCSEYLSAAVHMYEDTNVIFVNSAGNQAQDVRNTNLMLSSLVLKNFLNVGSLQLSQDLSQFSGFGTSINIWAPGENIPVLNSFSFDNSTDLASGTSLSAAYISGVVAVLWSRYPNETAPQIVSRVLRNSKKKGALQIFQF